MTVPMSPWSMPKVLFLFTRYVVFITLFVTLYYDHSPSSGVANCLTVARFTNWMINISLCITELLLTLRTWAVCGRHRGIAVFLIGVTSITVVSGLIIEGFWIRSLTSVMVPRQVRLSGCYAIITSKLMPLNYALTVAFYIVTLSLMSIKAYQCLDSGMDTKFTRIVYLDGTLYYVYLFSISLANLIMNFVLPLGYRGLLSTLQQLMNSILACRMVLHLRELGKQTTYGTFELPYIDALVFAHTDLEHE